MIYQIKKIDINIIKIYQMKKIDMIYKKIYEMIIYLIDLLIMKKLFDKDYE